MSPCSSVSASGQLQGFHFILSRCALQVNQLYFFTSKLVDVLVPLSLSRLDHLDLLLSSPYFNYIQGLLYASLNCYVCRDKTPAYGHLLASRANTVYPIMIGYTNHELSMQTIHLDFGSSISDNHTAPSPRIIETRNSIFISSKLISRSAL